MRVKKLVVVLVILLSLFGIYRITIFLFSFATSSKEIISDMSDTEDSYNSYIKNPHIPYNDFNILKRIYSEGHESKGLVEDLSLFDEVVDKKPNDMYLCLVEDLDLNRDEKIQYLMSPLEIVDFYNDSIVVYKYGRGGINYIAIDYKNTPLDCSKSYKKELGMKERVLVNLNSFILEDNILYLKGYKYGFNDIERTLLNLNFNEEDKEVRSAKFIESYLSLPYSPIGNMSIYLVEEDEFYYSFLVSYNDNKQLMIKCLKGSKPYIIYYDTIDQHIEDYFSYLEIFKRYEKEGVVIWESDF